MNSYCKNGNINLLEKFRYESLCIGLLLLKEKTKNEPTWRVSFLFSLFLNMYNTARQKW